MSLRLWSLILFCTVVLTGCAPVTHNQMVAKGSSPLVAKQIFDLVSGNTLYMQSIDFNAHLYFLSDGTMLAKGKSYSSDDQDSGGWDINNNNQLCLKFKVWYFGEMKCYSIFPNTGKDEYVLFHANGAIAYNAKASSGDSARLYKKNESSRKETTYLRESLTTGQPSSAPGPAPDLQSSGEPPQQSTFLRESLATAENDRPSSQEAGTAVIASQTPAPSGLAAPEEVEHTVKAMARNCPGCNLEKSDLRQADLIGANLQGAKLKGADLSRANLRRANLEGANLSGASLLSANLPGANLKGANLTNADFTGANLIKADFTGAKTENMILTNAHLEGVTGLK